MGYETQLTDARNALWLAIDNFPDLNNAFKKKFKFNDDGSCMKEPEPSFSDVPAIRIWPMRTTPKWYTNEIQDWPYANRVTIWTPDWNLPPIEKLVLRVIAAIYRATPANQTAPYVANYQPVIGPSTTFDRAYIGEQGKGMKVVIATIEVVLRTAFQPY